jgi:ubiquinone/menaquinone biosynthesis C-methylase UbiE
MDGMQARKLLVATSITSLPIATHIYQTKKLIMNKLSDKIALTRRRVCPRTSYATSGYAASTLFSFVVGDTSVEAQQIVNRLEEELVNVKEFDQVESFHAWNRLTERISGHVILCFVLSLELLQEVALNLISMLKQDSNKLFFILIPKFVVNGGNIVSILESYKTEFKIEESVYEEGTLLAVHKNNTFNRSLLNKKINYCALPIGFNGQPAVNSRCQFRYLWGLLPRFNDRKDFPTNEEREEQTENKARVLQRLADHECFDRSKRPVAYWDKLITDILQTPAGDDWMIYNALREQFMGHTIEHDIEHPPKPTKSADEEDGRVDFLVKCIWECLPTDLQTKPSDYVKNVLDYGCAEGAITASLGQRLSLPKESTFGADVRAITSHDFEFIQLPSEEEKEHDSSTVSSTTTNDNSLIFPMFANQSIDLVNASMVFHHVTHIEKVMKELRRIIAAKGYLIVREHDCTSPSSGIFLDIVHGLYSLVWQSPIEWPDFINEYKAFYRQREDWTRLLEQYGFRLASEQYRYHYDSAIRSTFNKKKLRFPNVTRAYYALYVPDPSYTKLIKPFPGIAGGDKCNDLSASKPTNKRKTPDHNPSSALETTNLQEILHDRNIVLYESTKYPGKFYSFNKATGQSEWIQ